MSMQIDRNENVIINQGGIAHRTGYIIIGKNGMGNTLELAPGHGGHTVATGHFQKQTGPTIWKGKREDFNKEHFLKVTGWTAKL